MSLLDSEKSLLVGLITKKLQENHRLKYALLYHKNTRGQFMDFSDKPYLVDIYNDNSRVMVFMKSVQCGISEFLVIESLSKCDYGLSTFYVLPKYEIRNTFVSNRIDKVLNSIPVYRVKMKIAVGESDSKQIKHFSKGTIKFVSSNTQSDFVEFPADMLIVDELDKCDQDNLAMAPDRLKSSKHKLIRMAGNPSINGFGIANEFKKSDQKEWVVKCDHCGTFQELDFFKNIVREEGENNFKLIDKEWNRKLERDIKCFCSKCSSEINRLSLNAHWQSMNPDSDISGYHISRIFDPNTQISELWDSWLEALGDETKKQIFYNSDLGIPYESKGSKLSEFVLDQCVGEYIMPQKCTDTIAGVDVGSVLHVNISIIDDEGRRKKVFIGTVPNFEEVDRLIDIFGVKFCVVDALPETHEAKKLRDRHPGKVWLCVFHSREGNTGDITINDDTRTIVVDRTQIFDETHADVIKQKTILPINAKSIDNGQFYEQMCAPTRILDDKSGRYVWREGTKADHYRLADVYEKVALKVKKQREIYFETQKEGYDFMPDME